MSTQAQSLGSRTITLPEDSILNSVVEQFGKRYFVCSFHFRRFSERRDFMTRQWRGEDGNLKRCIWTELILEPVTDKKSHPSVCVVQDALQRVFRGTDELTHVKNFENVPISAYSIAKDLVRATTGSDPLGPEVNKFPAIWISSINEFDGDKFPAVSVDHLGRVTYSKDWDAYGTPEFSARFPKFAAECEQFAKRQWAYCQFMCAQALSFHAGPQKNPRNINENHHLAAKWIEASPAEHPWIENISVKFGAMIECPICGQSTSSRHPKCAACGEIINKALYDRIKEGIDDGDKPQENRPPKVDLNDIPLRKK